MAFFGNANVNRLNIHYGIFSLVMNGGGAFYGVYLLRAGVPAAGVLTAMAAITLCRFGFRPAIPYLAARFGLKPLVITGTLICACQYLFLANVHGVGRPLLLLILVSSIGDTFYWTTYHAYFALVGDDHHRGHQISAREALAQVVSIIGPLLTGWMLTVYGPSIAFGASTLIMATAALPLLGAPNVKVARTVAGAFRAARPGILLFVADGWIASGYYMAWLISLFVTLHQNFNAYGGAMALAALVGAGAGMLLGRLIDAGHGQRAVMLSMAVFAATIGLRALSQGHILLAVIANACGAFVTCLYQPTLMTPVYTLAKASPCTLRFHVATEGGWDIGASAGCLVAAGLMSLGAPISVGVALSLVGLGAAFVLLRRYYSSLGSAGPAIEAALGGTP